MPTTEAQINANRANAQHSCGPVTEAGKAASSQNHRSHGMTGAFHLLIWEDGEQFQQFARQTYDEYKPSTPEERRLVDSVIQHYWLMQRAITYQDNMLNEAGLNAETLDQKRFSLFLRYQTTNERAYYKAQKEFQSLRKQKQLDQIGFESQKRNADLTEARTRLANAKAEATEIESELKTTMEAPLPGHARIPLEDVKAAFILALQDLNRKTAENLHTDAVAA
jgi:hypothetical protein